MTVARLCCPHCSFLLLSARKLVFPMDPHTAHTPVPSVCLLVFCSFFFCAKNVSTASCLGGTSGKESTCQCRRCGFDPWFGKIPLEKEMATLSSILFWRIPWTGEPRWAIVHGVAQSLTRLINWARTHARAHTPTPTR